MKKITKLLHQHILKITKESDCNIFSLQIIEIIHQKDNHASAQMI